MKYPTTLILGALISLALIGSANAAPKYKLSRNVIGSWCTSYGDITRTTTADANENENEKEKCGDAIMTIKSDHYEGWEHSCDYTEVKTWFDRTIPLATKTPLGVTVARIKSRCGGEGCRWQEEMTVYFSKGSLFIKNRKHYAEKCEG